MNNEQITRPVPDGATRRTIARERRQNATLLSGPNRLHEVGSNNEESDHDFAPVANFSKGLQHDDYGLATSEHYKAFVTALCQLKLGADGIGDFDVPGPYQTAPADDEDGLPPLTKTKKDYRQWESPLAGLYYSLEGPDPAGVAMAPAPRLGSSELCAEMAEVYAFALVRDIPMSDLIKDSTPLTFVDPSGAEVALTYPAGHPAAGTQATMKDLRDELAKLNFLNPAGTPVSSQGGTTLTQHEQRRRDARFSNGAYTTNAMFRGSTVGAKAGPMLSQFLLLGTPGRAGSGISPTDGLIQFGAQSISQKVATNTPGQNYMTHWDEWLNVQNAAKISDPSDFFTGQQGFLRTPRDLATYVHFDQLYQAYFNACLIMLVNGAGFSPGFPNASGDSPRGAFATFGGPHILSLLTEVASRGLKAVRRQKFQIHRRARPEVIAARLTQVHSDHDKGMHADAKAQIKSMLNELGAGDPANPAKPGVLLYWIDQINTAKNDATPAPAWQKAGGNYLLPMAFPEGSPMHPAYGAGHATVAGACITVLKAFFNTRDNPPSLAEVLKVEKNVKPEWVTVGKGKPVSILELDADFEDGQTLEGELDKLAANISIGRNMAGVHYYSDYFDSLRLGERIAAGIIEEQMLNYTEKVSMSFTSFDGDPIEIKTTGAAVPNAVSFVVDGGSGHREEWFNRHVADHLSPFIGN